MAVIHHTTLTPSKLELLADWLPAQPWYAGTEHQARPAKAGGFRLDDPDGEVGIEFMVVNDGDGDHVLTYHVPLSYRGAPLDGADDALIGTTAHGVLGKRWVYDGVHFTGAPEPVAGRSITVVNGPHGTDLIMGPAMGSEPELTIRAARVLEPLQELPDWPGYVTATWRSPDGAEARGLFAALLAARSQETGGPSDARWLQPGDYLPSKESECYWEERQDGREHKSECAYG